jgi:hypothetical protein
MSLGKGARDSQSYQAINHRDGTVLPEYLRPGLANFRQNIEKVQLAVAKIGGKERNSARPEHQRQDD